MKILRRSEDFAKINFFQKIMIKTYESRIPPSPNLDKVTVTVTVLTDLFLQIHGIVNVFHRVL